MRSEVRNRKYALVTRSFFRTRVSIDNTILYPLYILEIDRRADGVCGQNVPHGDEQGRGVGVLQDADLGAARGVEPEPCP